jgi:shikimate kinase
MRELMAERYPIYGEADVTIESRDVSHEVVVKDVLCALAAGPLVDREVAAAESKHER